MSTKTLTDGDPEELIECPIDPVHILRRKRMPYHIIKCAKNFNMKDYEVCPFNYRHIIPKAEMGRHLQECDDRTFLERELLQSQRVGNADGDGVPMLKGYTGVPTSTFIPPEPQEESWDDSNVVVEIVPPRNLFSSDSEPVPRRRQEREVTPEEAPATSCVKEPPNPRLPVMSGAGGSEVYNLATTLSPTHRARGRGRGRGTALSPPKVGGRPQLSNSPSSTPSPPRVGGMAVLQKEPQSDVPPGFGVAPLGKTGRGRGLMQFPPAMNMAEEQEEEKKKKQRKLKKMMKQILELEEKERMGQPLNADQVAKLSRKQDVLTMLEQMHLQD